MTVDIIKVKYPQIPNDMAEMIASLPNDKKALALADLDQAIMLMGIWSIIRLKLYKL